jgi:DNA excision repair protein ERCC-4
MHVKPDRVGTDEEDGEGDSKPSAAFMMRKKLRSYLTWKKDFATVNAALFSENQKALSGAVDQKGQGAHRGRAPPNKRRRVRGGGSVASASARTSNGSVQPIDDKAAQVASLLAEIRPGEAEISQKQEIGADPLDDTENFFEMYEMNDLVLIHPYDGDMDEHVLEEVKPRYIIMYEPDAAFIRRVEVYRSSHNDRDVRVYFMYYGGSVEEQRYLSSVRKEKEAFTKLIREKGVSNCIRAMPKLILTWIEHVHYSNGRWEECGGPRGTIFAHS